MKKKPLGRGCSPATQASESDRPLFAEYQEKEASANNNNNVLYYYIHTENFTCFDS